jgi:succinate-acetate transporter protein
MAANGSSTAERVREYAPTRPHHSPEFETPEEERNDPLGGDPAMVGLPAFIVGAIALGLTLVGFVSPESAGAPVAIILAATGVGQMMAAVWSARLGQSAEASVFMIFGGFWISYGVLVLGLGHNWFGVTESDLVHTQGIFLIAWLATVVMLTLATLRLPSVFTLLFVLVDISLALSLISTLSETPSIQHAAGIAVFAFTAVGVYLYFSAASEATGGNEMPMGRPIIGS